MERLNIPPSVAPLLNTNITVEAFISDAIRSGTTPNLINSLSDVIAQVDENIKDIVCAAVYVMTTDTIQT